MTQNAKHRAAQDAGPTLAAIEGRLVSYLKTVQAYDERDAIKFSRGFLGGYITQPGPLPAAAIDLLQDGIAALMIERFDYSAEGADLFALRLTSPEDR